MYSTIQDNILGSFIDKGINYERTGEMGTQKYLKESCYYRIECSAANSLVTLMRKWYLNSAFHLYSYFQRLQEGADGIRINTINLLSTWRVEMKGEM